MILPKMYRVKQDYDTYEIENLEAEIEKKIKALAVLSQEVQAGQSVAVACSSRGIADHATIVGTTVRCLKEAGLKPFIMPAMGSHGGGTAAGQRKVLELAGITEEKMGVPIMSSMETEQIGQTDDGIPVFLDKHAAQADWIVPVNRIKSHTMFNGKTESGLIKMLAVGLGKKDGPEIYHNFAFNFGLEHVLQTVARVVMAHKPVLFGVGVVENAYCHPAKIGVFESQELETEEAKYLIASKKLEPQLPLEEIDVLIIDEMGKDISGAGIDCNVIGRLDMPLLGPNPASPNIKRIIVSDLTAKTEGNAIGLGLADIITERLFKKLDMEAMNVNALTASDPEHVKIPMIMPNDAKAINAATTTIGMVALEDLKIMRIKNTKTLDKMVVSGPCVTALKDKTGIIIDPESFEVDFDSDGNLPPLS